MLDYLGVTENWSAIENIPWTQRWMFSDDATREPVSLDGVTFTGKIYIEGDLEPVTFDIQKSSVAEETNVLIVSCTGLPEGRHPYEIFAVSESGNQNRLISGYIGVIKSIGKLVDDTKTYASRTLSIRLPGNVTRQIRLEWNSCTLASLSAEQAMNAAKQTHADADTASQAATTATGAASTATERAKEAEGYAGAAHASEVAAGNSAVAASVSAANAARDAKTANDVKAAVDELASTWPQTVSNAEQTISFAEGEAVSAIQTKQADSVLAVGRASQTAQQNITSAQSIAVTAVETARTEAVQAVQTARTEAVETITPLVVRAETAKREIDQAEGRIKTAETNAGTSATDAANSAAAVQQALEAIPQVDAGGNMTLAGGLTTAAAINANGGINIPAAVAPRLTGAVTNHELVDYLVDRVVRTAPYMTRISGLELADFYDKSQSTAPLTLLPYSGEVRLNGPGGANNVSRAVFAGPGGYSLIVPPTQCGPYYYQKHVTVISSSSLLCMSYLTSPGALVQVKLGVRDDTQYYGVRLRNDDGAAYYELFYKDVADDQETVVVREPVPKGVSLYTGNHSAQSRLNSLVICVPGNFSGTSSTVVKFGQWSMTVPFALYSNAQLELSARTGNVAISYYGVGLGVSIGSIHQIALDYQEQFVPTLNNAAYKL